MANEALGTVQETELSYGRVKGAGTLPSQLAHYVTNDRQ
jgi:hypothetical protein